MTPARDGRTDEVDGIEDDSLRLIMLVPDGFDVASLGPLAEQGGLAGLVLSPADEPDQGVRAGHALGLAVQVRDDLAKARRADGVLLTDPARLAAAREALGPRAIIGVACGIDRHAAMEAGEAGADWILFGQPDMAPERAIDAAAWWSELFVLPCGVTGTIRPDHIAALAAAKIAFAVPGPSCWTDREPLDVLLELDSANAAR